MSAGRVIAASYLGPEGFGNHQTGLRPWPAPLCDALPEGELDGLHWSLVSDSDPSRFLRMDLMCRLGFMAAELLRVDFDAMSADFRDHVGVCVESFSGSLETDVRFTQTPRPSLFAYTLPSTVIGELCIRYRLKGPGLSLGAPSPGGPNVLAEAADWLAQGDAEMVLCLTVEALNRRTAALLGWPAPSWHAAAALLAPGGGSSGPPGSLLENCRALCAGPKQACQWI